MVASCLRPHGEGTAAQDGVCAVLDGGEREHRTCGSSFERGGMAHTRSACRPRALELLVQGFEGFLGGLELLARRELNVRFDVGADAFGGRVDGLRNNT